MKWVVFFLLKTNAADLEVLSYIGGVYSPLKELMLLWCSVGERELVGKVVGQGAHDRVKRDLVLPDAAGAIVGA